MTHNRRLINLEAEVQTLKTLLVELYPRLDLSSTQQIHETLDKVAYPLHRRFLSARISIYCPNTY